MHFFEGNQQNNTPALSPVEVLQRVAVEEGYNLNDLLKNDDVAGVAEVLAAHAQEVMTAHSVSKEEQLSQIARLYELVDLSIDNDDYPVRSELVRVIEGIAFAAEVCKQKPRKISPLVEEEVQKLVQHSGLRLLAYLDFSENYDYLNPFSIDIPEGTVLDNIYFGNAFVGAMNLQEAQMDVIRVGDSYEEATPINIANDTVISDTPLVWRKYGCDEKAVLMPHCPEVETRTSHVIKTAPTGSIVNVAKSFARAHSEPYSADGVVVCQDDVPLGFIKMYGEKSFVALRTVCNEHGKTLMYRGQVCAIGEQGVSGGTTRRPGLNLALASIVGEACRSEPHQRWFRYDLSQYANNADPVRVRYQERLVGAQKKYLKNSENSVDSMTHIPITPMRFLTDPALYTTLAQMTKHLDKTVKKLPNLSEVLKQ